MMVLPLALSFLGNLAVFLFVLVCVAIILIVLLQKGRGGGIGAAFGGGGAGSLLGTKTGDFLTWVTICLVSAFLVLAVLMGKFMGGSAVNMGTPAIGAANSAPADDTTTEPTDAEEATAAPAGDADETTTDTTEPVAEPAAEPTN